MIDTHCHLCDAKYDEDRVEVAQRFFANNTGIIIGCEYSDMSASARLACSYDNAYYAVGLHPNYAAEYDQGKMRSLVDVTDPKLVAIGEIGLDYYWDKGNKEQQKTAFASMIALAKECSLPIIVHCRDAYGDCMEVLTANAPYPHGGVMHCYSGSAEWANEAIKLGMYISFSGSITYKNASSLRSVAQGLPLDKILSETDSPYLSPEGRRGMRNEPIYVSSVVETLAVCRGVSYEAMNNIIYNNTRALFTKIKATQ